MNIESFIKELQGIKEMNQNTIQKYFDDLAKILFNHMKICAGDDTYTFLEIEFYYHNKTEFDDIIYNCTYPRTRNAGQFFWHNSGVDVCFESKEDEGYFGGILIRSLMKNGKEVIAGPMRCANELKNSCNETISAPYLSDSSETTDTIYSTIRYGVGDENQTKDKAKLFCYYIDPGSWTRIRNNVLVIDTKNKKYKLLEKRIDSYNAQPTKRLFPPKKVE